MPVGRVFPLVTSAWLKQRLLPLLGATGNAVPRLNKDFRLLDTSWLPEPEVDGYKEFYRKSHIPGAVHFDLNKLSSRRPDSPIDCPIPDKSLFKDYVESLGISNKTQVIAYDSLNTRPSVRTWYLFKLFGHDTVAVLNGGMVTWQKEGLQVTQTEPNLRSLENLGAQFEVNFRPKMLLDYQQMLNIVDSQSAQIVDSRPASGGFYVTKDDQSGGHMPQAKSVPFGKIFNEDGTFKTEKDLEVLFAEAGVNVNAPMVATCQRGMTACALVIAAQIMEKKDMVPMYNGSWCEWSAIAESRNIVRETLPKV